MGRDGIAGLICLVVSLALLAATRGLPEASLLVPVGPGFYPRIILSITALISVLLVVTDFVARRRAAALPPPAKPQDEKVNYALVTLTFALFGIYVGVLPYVGFRIATFCFVAALQASLEPPQGLRGWAKVGATALITTVVTYFVFESYLSVLLPRGRWTDF